MYHLGKFGVIFLLGGMALAVFGDPAAAGQAVMVGVGMLLNAAILAWS